MQKGYYQYINYNKQTIHASEKPGTVLYLWILVEDKIPNKSNFKSTFLGHDTLKTSV